MKDRQTSWHHMGSGPLVSCGRLCIRFRLVEWHTAITLDRRPTGCSRDDGRLPAHPQEAVLEHLAVAVAAAQRVGQHLGAGRKEHLQLVPGGGGGAGWQEGRSVLPCVLLGSWPQGSTWNGGGRNASRPCLVEGAVEGPVLQSWMQVDIQRGLLGFRPQATARYLGALRHDNLQLVPGGKSVASARRKGVRSALGAQGALAWTRERA